MVSANAYHGAVKRCANPNLMTVFNHSPSYAVPFDFAVLHRQFEGIGLADQVEREVIEANRHGAIPFGSHPGVAAMIEQLVRAGDTGILGLNSWRQRC
jgi:hypothetical protein